jgi:hypothetical protein
MVKYGDSAPEVFADICDGEGHGGRGGGSRAADLSQVQA